MPYWYPMLECRRVWLLKPSMKSETAQRAWLRVAKLVRSKSSVLRVAKNDSATASSNASPGRPIDTVMPRRTGP